MQVKILETKSSLASVYLASEHLNMNLLFVLAVELYVHMWLRVWVYTHIYMLLKMLIRKDIF